jgi:hypothetical protein
MSSPVDGRYHRCHIAPPSPVAGIGLNLWPLARRTSARTARARCPGAALRRSWHRRHRRLGLPHSLWGPIPAGTCLRWWRGLACAILRQCRPHHYNGRNYQQHWQKRQDRRYRTRTEALDVDKHDGGRLVDIAPKEKRRRPEAVHVRDGFVREDPRKALPVARATGSVWRVSAVPSATDIVDQVAEGVQRAAELAGGCKD